MSVGSHISQEMGTRIMRCKMKQLRISNRAIAMIVLFLSFNLPILGHSQSSDIDGLIQALKESQEPCLAAQELGRIKDPSSIEPLIEALEHEHESVRNCTIIALGMIGDHRACKPLIKTYMHGGDPITQYRARRALSMIGCSFKEHAREYAIEGKLCDMGQELINVIPPLIEKYPHHRDWSKSKKWKNATKKILAELNRLDTDDPEASKRLYVIFFYISDWSDAVTTFHELTSKDNKMGAAAALDRIDRLKTNFSILCPDLKVPDHNMLQ